ncbi:MAG TPA: heavy-metal-associated domain-containing protein [Ktedonobacteraceae bacterium]
MSTIQDIVLSVPDVSCEHCVKTINGALGELPGVETVSTDIPSKSVHLRYDPAQLSMEQIENTLDDAGYTISENPAQAPRSSGKPLNLL